MRAYAVIGANYGDEGKGLITDYLCNRLAGGLVVRFNGGAQAGHTVVTPSGHRHVFHHFGSGSLVGWPTYLSQHFICNPMLFMQEHKDLVCITAEEPVLGVDPRALVTTPYDMLINQVLEMSRGNARHGSCGIGINETVERCQHKQYKTTVGTTDADTLTRIIFKWVPIRLKHWGLPHDILDQYDVTHMMRDWFAAFTEFKEYVGILKPWMYNTIVFEGAQGLALDQKSRDFPYVTRSNTGVRNVIELCDQWGFTKLDIFYVTRAYFTRHGAGPLPHETDMPREIKDATNILHPWQGPLRYAPMDKSKLLSRIYFDIGSNHIANMPADSLHLAVTCTDQTHSRFDYVKDGRVESEHWSFSKIAEYITSREYNLMWSEGPTCKDVRLR